ncbi:hypothetical protein ACSQ67_013418 [Phaseolus vulgaris]
MKKAIGQTVRELKREVNKKVLKVPGIEQKILDATSNEAWGPHGSLLADIAQATRNYHEYQIIMEIIWKRINDTGKNWRHVYKALTVLEYVVANGSERVIEEIREHAHQISTLSNFQYIDSSGRDQGNNVRKKSQNLILLVNDKERIIEVRQKAAANRDKFRASSTGGMYRPGSHSSSGAYGDRYEDDRYGSREEDRSDHGYGREREWGYRDDDRYSREGDRYGKDYEERYRKDGYRDDEYHRRSVDDGQYGSRSRSSDRDHDHNVDDDGQRSSGGSIAKAEAHSMEGRLEQKLSEQNGWGISTAKGSSPVNDNPTQTTAASTATSGNPESKAFDEFDPRGHPASAARAPASNVELDLFGSLSEPFSSNALAPVASAPETTTSQANTNLDSTVAFAPPPSATNNFNTVFEDPFGDSPFKALPSAETPPPQPQTHQSRAPSQPSGSNTESVSNFGFGDSFSALPRDRDTQSLPLNSQFLSPSQETDILADILPLPGTTSQQNFSAHPDAQASSSFSASSGQMASQSFFAESGQHAQQGFSAGTSQPAAEAVSVPGGQLLQPLSSNPTSQRTQQPFPSHTDQSVPSVSHIYGGFPPQAGSMTEGASSMFPQTQECKLLSSQSPIDQASQFNSGILMAQQQGHALQNAVSQPSSKDKFETKSTVWADTLSRGLVNLNISGPKINPLANIGVDFDAINRKEKRMEKPTTTSVTSTVTMGKAMGSGSGMGRVGSGAFRPPPTSNPVMGMGMGSYGGMNAPVGMGMGMNMRGMGQMQPPPAPTGLPPGYNMPGNYNSMMGTGGGYPQYPYGLGGYRQN